MNWYYGIREAYPRLQVVFGQKLPAIVQNARPYTLMAPLLGGFGIMLGAGAVTGTHPWVDMVVASVVLALLNGAGNQFNAIYDQAIDAVNKPYRPLVTGELSEDAVYSVGVFMYVIATALASFVNAAFLAFMVVLFVFSLYYSVPPIRAKQRLWVNNVWQAGSRGLFGTVAAWSVVADPLSPIPWGFGLVTGTWMLAAQTAKDFPDVEGDKKFGVRTLPVVYGKPKTKQIMGKVLVAAFSLLGAFLALGVLPTKFVYFFLLALPSALVVKGVDMETELMENNVGWVSMYATLTLFYLGFPVVLALA